ncbi:hypothetical protein [Galbibacter sp. BG1]
MNHAFTKASTTHKKDTLPNNKNHTIAPIPPPSIPDTINSILLLFFIKIKKDIHDIIPPNTPKTIGKTPNETSDDIDNFNSSPP